MPRLPDGAVSTEPHSKQMAAQPRHAHPHDHVHEHQHHAQAPPHPFDADALISARGLWLTLGGRTIIESVDLDIARGEIVTLIGPNGAGKTTLVRLLLSLQVPDQGGVHRAPGTTIGYAPQRFDLDRSMPMTAARFVSLGAPGRASGVDRVLAEVGAARVRDQQLADLSGGELQRVVLARALLREPDLLVLDEPVRGVDYVGEAELYALIGRLRDTHRLGVLLVSHDLHVVMAASDRVICLNRHVCCHGVPDAVAQHPEYTRLFGAEAARAFAIYSHHHDHAHDLAGAPLRKDTGGPKP